MKKRVNIITVVVLMALMGLLTYVITYYSVQSDLTGQLEVLGKREQEMGSFFIAFDEIEKKFIGEFDKQRLIQGAIDGMVRATGDKWSHYFNPEAFRAYLGNLDNQSIGPGVSVVSGLTPLRIYEVMPGSPAEDAGLRIGDLITHIDDISVESMGFDTSLDKMHGAEFNVVSLTIERPSEGGGHFTVDVMRRAVFKDPVTSGILDTANGKIGVVRISNFDKGVDDEFNKTIGELVLAGVGGLIFDVRNNPGGDVDVLVAALDLLLPEGDLITLRYKDGREDKRTSGPEHIDLPMAVLINGDSVSAAEFFAACLREYDKAVLVGEKTGGKGYAQEIIRLTSDQSGLYLSTSEYVTSKGVSLAGAGLMPDVEIALTEEGLRYIGSMDPSLDPQLARALLELSRNR
jgi:carboxyl-terminal processing protease